MIKVKYRVRIDGRVLPFYGFAYSVNEPVPVEYYDRNAFKNVIFQLKEGDHVETKDGFVVPVIKSRPSFLRFLNFTGKSMQKGRNWLSYNWHKVVFYDEKKKIKPKRYLNDRQVLFCYEMAKTYDIKHAAQVAGYNIVYAFKLLTYDKIRNGIKMSLDAQMKSLSIDESDIFLKRYLSMMDSLQGAMERSIQNNELQGLEYAKLITENLNNMAALLNLEKKNQNIPLPPPNGNGVLLPKSTDIFYQNGVEDIDAEEKERTKEATSV